MSDLEQVRNQLLSDWAEIILLTIDKEITHHFDQNKTESTD